jgi:fermentation-respiration switch protein FrsA (DUF1100 family)
MYVALAARIRRGGAAHAWHRLSGNGSSSSGIDLSSRIDIKAYDGAVPWRLTVVAFAILLLLVLLVTALLVALQDKLVFFPDRQRRAEPAQYGLAAEALSLRAADGVVLDGWWVRGAGRTALVYFPGNAGNIGDRLERTKLLAGALGLDVFLVDYRGYGRSGGSPTEEGLYADGLAVYEAAVSKGFPAKRIVLFGESLGCAVALETALRKPCAGLILEAPFLSVAAMARHYYPWIPAFFIRLRFANGEKIARLTVPKLIAQAERDQIVPPRQTLRLFELAAPPKTYFVIQGASHNDTYAAGGRAYLDAWKRFLEKILPADR